MLLPLRLDILQLMSFSKVDLDSKLTLLYGFLLKFDGARKHDEQREMLMSAEFRVRFLA
jgi:hypothetical protein